MKSPARHWAGKWAVVTGASSGIGRAIATELAAGGTNLVLTARRAERLQELASGFPVQTEICPADLERPEGPREVFDFTETRGIRPDLLVNNAGFGVYGEFREMDPDRQLAMVQVNCGATLALTQLYLPGMIDRRQGDILIVASTAAFQPLPYQVTYAATKAFDLHLAEGLAEEVSRFGVRVCALCPGHTTSEFHAVAAEPIPKGMQVQTAEDVARIGLRAMSRGKRLAICGFRNRMGVEILRISPRRVVTAVTGKWFKPDHIRH